MNNPQKLLQNSTTKDYPINNRYYYILYYDNILTPKLLPIYFTSLPIAEQQLAKEIPKQFRHKYEVVKGSEIKDVLKYRGLNVWKLGVQRKFKYPDNCITKKDKKNFRIISRRRLRRMGVYYRTKAKGYVFDKEHKPEFIKNVQVLTQNKSGRSISKAFKLDRMGESIIYVLLEKLDRKPEDCIFRCRAIRINLKAGTRRTVTMKVYNHDIMRPYLLTELYHELLHSKNAPRIIVFCQKNGVKFTRAGAAKVLSINIKKINNGKSKSNRKNP